MRISYGVVWQEADEPPCAGRLSVAADRVVLVPFDAETPVERELRYDTLCPPELQGPEERPTLVLRTTAGRVVELESAVNNWIFRDLDEQFSVGETSKQPASGRQDEAPAPYPTHLGLGL